MKHLSCLEYAELTGTKGMNNEPENVQDWIDCWQSVYHIPSKEELAIFVSYLLQEERARMVKVLEEFLESIEHTTDEVGDLVAVEDIKHFFSDIIRRLTHLMLP